MNRHLHDGHGTDNEEPTDISLPHLRRSAQLLLSSRRVLFRHQSDPSRKISTPSKDLHWWGESRNSHGRDWADAWHGLETACGIVFCRFGAHLFLKLADLFGKRCDLLNVD